MSNDKTPPASAEKQKLPAGQGAGHSVSASTPGKAASEPVAAHQDAKHSAPTGPEAADRRQPDDLQPAEAASASGGKQPAAAAAQAPAPDLTAPNTQQPVKLDPEMLAIRQKPARAIQIKRKAMLALFGSGSLMIGLVTGWSLYRPTPGKTNLASDGAQSSGSNAPSSISGQPADYGAVPQLGPPLPGDLGKPILERQQQMLAQPPSPEVQRAAQEVDAQRQQLKAEGKAARESGLLAHSSNDEGGIASSAGPASSLEVRTEEPAPTEAGHVALDAANDPNGQQRKSDFLKAADQQGDVDPHRMMPAPSPYTLSAGSVIAASLITGLHSDLPGLVTAQVTENVYDSATGLILLVPQGARLIGSYDSVVAFGQHRALVAWQRIVMPNGSSVTLDNVSATDPSGYAGLEDKVDLHTWRLLEGVTMSTLLGVGSQLQFSGQGDLVQALRQSSEQNVSRAGDQLTSKSLDVQPSITIRPGAPVRLVVHHDLILTPWEGAA